jgi:hypothetical protein
MIRGAVVIPIASLLIAVSALLLTLGGVLGYLIPAS